MPETVVVGPGETHREHVGSGQTLEGKLYDITADGASLTISPEGSGWVVRNIGIKGEHPGGHYILKPSTEGRDGTGLIENLYAADGQDAGSGKGFCWVDHNDGNDGTITFRNVNIQGFVDNAIYGSSSAHPNNSGVVNLEDSMIRNNNISNFRAGTPDGRTAYVRNSVIEGTAEDTPPCGVGCSAPGAQNPRGIWAWYGTVMVEGSDVTGTPPRATNEGGNIESRNSRFGSNANIGRVPAGVPTTAEMAANGGGAGGSGDSHGFLGGNGNPGSGGSADVFAPDGGTQSASAAESGAHEITLKGSGSYSFDVSGAVTENTPFGSEAGSVSDGHVEGELSGDDTHDDVQFTGALSGLQTTGDVTVSGEYPTQEGPPTPPNGSGSSGGSGFPNIPGLPTWDEIWQLLTQTGPISSWAWDNRAAILIGLGVLIVGLLFGIEYAGHKVAKGVIKG